MSAGARAATSIAECCSGRDVIVTIVADDAAVKEVTLGQGGVRESMPSGAVHLVMGTHSVATVQALASAHLARQQSMVSAPVLGRPDVAAAGQLAIVAAGPAESVQRCAPLFQVMDGVRSMPASSRRVLRPSSCR